MGEKTGISWTDATFNPWWGCTKVSPGCDNCYAERDAHRFAPDRTLWGVNGERRTFGDKHWNDPLRWAKKLPAKLGRRPRVFCASMADVFDKDAPETERERLWKLISATPELDWLLLTKRVGNVRRMLPDAWRTRGLPGNVWLGISVVNQEEVKRDVPKLLDVNASVRWLSCEPLLDYVDLTRIPDGTNGYSYSALTGAYNWTRNDMDAPLPAPKLHWVVVGGESGARARPMEHVWCEHIREDCREASVPFFMKQGSQHNWDDFKSFDAFPEVLRVREFPAAKVHQQESMK